MIVKVNLPKSGMGIEEGTISKWLKEIGDRVTKGEPIVEVETAKAVQQVEAPVAGTLIEIIVGEGQTTPVNTDIASIKQDE